MRARAAAAAVVLAAALAASPALAQGAPPPPPAFGTGEGEQPPAVTLLYQNFPNPFAPTPGQRTCIWFDLAEDSDVRLEVRDVRGRLVRVLLPAAGFFGTVPAGRYGRGTGTECDPVVSWDGTDAEGNVVPMGVYLLRLTAAGERVTRKIVVRGR